MTHKERFFNDKGYAAATIGSAQYVHPVDYNVFKKTSEQKLDTIAAKFKHKKIMQEKGVNPKKFLNIPEYRLETPILITT